MKIKIILQVVLIMGVVVSIFGGNTGKTDDPDPVTGLTSREKYLVTSTWADVRKKPTEHGVNLLLKFFEIAPEYLKLFPFSNIPVKDLPDNKRFQAHCTSVIYGLSIIIDQLNNNDLLVASLKKVGETHKPRGVPAEAYPKLQDAAMEYFSKSMNKDQLAAWKKTLDCAFAVIIQGIPQ